jgi:enoyl-CoA hydratase
MILTGELMSAKDAERFGLINRIAPKDKLNEVAMEMAKFLASKPPLAIKFTKLANCETRDQCQLDAVKTLNEYLISLLETEDAAEGLKAFGDKRNYEWKGK